MKILSWNVNGLRAVDRKGALKNIWDLNPDIFCLQEIKISEDEIPFDLKFVNGYKSFFSSAQKKGYSGVGLYTKQEPLSVAYTFGEKEFDSEGRIIQAKFSDFILFNIYFPNGKASKARLDYKMNFYHSFLEKIKYLFKNGENIIICGDINTAHKEIDLARPKQNEKISGFLPEERSWIDELIKVGFIDAFRKFNQKPEQYTWWDLKSRARERNIGWRIDYFFITKSLEKNLSNCEILSDISGSDHAPILLNLKRF